MFTQLRFNLKFFGTIFVVLVFLVGGLFISNTVHATTPTLGVAATYGVLSSTYINTSASTAINGDVGFTTPPAVIPLGTHANYGGVDPYSAAGTAQAAALANLNGQGCTFTFDTGAVVLSDNVQHGSSTYIPGVYCINGAVSIGSTITLSGTGTYIFRSTGALNAEGSSIVTLAGASADDVFWTPNGATTLNADSTFIGNVIPVSQPITLLDNVSWTGRALAFGGTVTTGSGDTITVPEVLVETAPIFIDMGPTNGVLDVGEQSFTTIQAAVTAASPNDTIVVTAGTYDLSAQINISKPLSIIGQGTVTLRAISDFGTNNISKHLLTIYSGTLSNPVRISNIVLDNDNKAYGVNTYDNAYGIFENVTITKSKGAGLTINGSTITATNLNTNNNSWGGVNIDPGSGVTTPSILTLNSGTLEENTQIWSDGSHVNDTATVTVTATGYNMNKKGGTPAFYVWTNKGLNGVATIGSTIYSTIQLAINAAVSGDTINIYPGNYNLVKDDVNSFSGQTGWYLPITKNNITLQGVDENGQDITNASNVATNIYSTDETPNGSWASQDLIAIFGNNITIRGLGIMNKISPNKAIEVLGNNFKAENNVFSPISVDLLPSAADYFDPTPTPSAHNDITKYGSGIYFNNNGATEARTGTVTNNILKNSGITFDSFGSNWTMSITGNTFDGNKIWSWTDNTGFQSQYYSSIGSTTWANQPDFTGSTININENKFINMQSGEPILKIKDTMTGIFNATNNWWGDASGPATGTIIGNVVNFNPYYISDAMTTTNTDVTTGLTNAKTSAHLVLTNAIATYNQTDYIADNWTTLNGFKTTGDTNIDASTNTTDVTSAQNTATTGMSGVIKIVINNGGGGGYYIRAIPAKVETPDGCKTGDKFSTTTGKSCGQVLGAEKFNFTKFMKNGSNGNEIIELQKLLTSLGYDCGTADGKFGTKTKGAVIKFQTANKLVGDGVVGAKTRALLNKSR